jgi:hypothetical protein
MKCLWGLELIFGLIFVAVVLHMTFLALIAIFRCVSMVPNPVPRASSFSIAT